MSRLIDFTFAPRPFKNTILFGMVNLKGNNADIWVDNIYNLEKWANELMDTGKDIEALTIKRIGQSIEHELKHIFSKTLNEDFIIEAFKPE